jgi:hypothetical protein
LGCIKLFIQLLIISASNGEEKFLCDLCGRK